MAGSGLPFGKYYLLDRINVGGMAEVFKAKTLGVEGFERLVAIKRILPSIAEDADFVRMFIDEAKITVLLNHANIAQTYDLGRIQDTYFIAMEYVPGRDLRSIWERLRKRGEVAPYPLSAYVMARVCEGLDYAHRKKDGKGRDLGIVHRDVSPQNVICSFEGEVKVIDFGIAKAANKISRTQAGILKGKFGYMSPEQVRGLPLDRRSDLFSAGVVLYEMVTGERLFRGDSDFSILEKVRAARIVPPTRVNKGVPAGLERIILKALTREAEARYQWASEMQADLTRFLSQATDPPFARDDLAAFMKRTYGPEMELERTGHSVATPHPVAPSAPIHHMPGSAPQGDGQAGSRAPPPLPAGAGASTDRPPPRPPPPPLAALFDDEEGTPTPQNPTEVVSERAIFRDLVTTQPMRAVTGDRRPSDKAGDHAVNDAATAVGRRPHVNPAGLDPAASETTGPQLRVGGAAAEMGDSTVSTRSRPGGGRRGRAARGAVLAAMGAAGVMAAYYLLTVPAPAPEASPTQPALVPTTGELIVAVTPAEAEIIIDQRIEKPAGDPRFFNDRAFPAGRHQIRARLKGYAEMAKGVELPPGGRIIRNFNLEPLEADLMVRSNPPGAAVSMDGLDREDRTPARIAGLKATESYTVLIRKPPCYAPVEKTVALQGEPHRELFVELDLIPGACPDKQRSAAGRSPPAPAPEHAAPVAPAAPVSDAPRVPAAVDSPASASAPKPGSAPPAATGSANASILSGYLRVTSKPAGARVFVNDADAGTTPILNLPVPAGPARIRIIAKDGRSEETVVQVRANEVYTHIAKF